MTHPAALSLLALALVAAPSGAATFRVEGPAGDAVAGARVAVYGPPLAQTLTGRSAAGPKEFESGTDGQVQGELPVLTPRLVFVDHPDFAPLALAGPNLGAVRLAPGERLTGRARPARGETISGRACARWRVAVEDWGRQIPVERCRPLAADGRFELLGIGTERVSVEISAAAHLPARLTWQRGEAPLDVKLEPGVLVRGRVVDPVGQGVGGVEVAAKQAAPVTTEPDGRFTLAVPALPWELAFSGPGLRARRATAAVDPARPEPEFRLEWGQEIKGGLVLDDGERPVRPLLIAERFVPPGGWNTDRMPLTLDEAGGYRVQLDRPGRYRLRLKADGYREQTLSETEIVAGSMLDLGLVALRRGAGFRCRIVDEESGEPVAGAEIRLLAQGSAVIEQIRRRASWSTVSREDGASLVWGLEPGRYEVRVRRDGYAPSTAEVEVEADRLAEGDDISLGPGIELVGEVRTRAGLPVAGARVQLFDPAGLGLVPVAEVTADEAGAYRRLVVAAGSYRVKVQGPRQSATQTIEVEAGEELRRIDLTLPGVRLDLLLRDGGEPVPAGTFLSLTAGLDPGLRLGKVIIQGVDELTGQQERMGIPEPPRTARVGDQGEVTIDDVPVGPTLLEVVPLDGGPPVVRQLAIPDVGRHRAEIELASPGLSGRITTAGRSEPPRARARVFEARGLEVAGADTAEDGTFVVAGLEPGRYTLSVEAEGFAPAVLADLDVPPEGRVVEVELEPADLGAIEVRLGRVDGGALVSASIVLLGAAGEVVRALWTDAEGHLRLEGLPPGEYDLVWTDAVVGSGAASGLKVEAGETLAIERSLGAGGDLLLTCPPERCGGRTIEDLWLTTRDGVELSAFLGGAVTQRQVGVDGTLTLGRLSAGTYRVAGRAGAVRWFEEVVVDGGRGLRVSSLPPPPPARPASP
jgi:hypothetical protein